jgi:hypothetical protein
MSHHLTVEPILIIHSSSRFFNLASDIPGMSFVVSSGPSLVSATSISYSSIWIDVSLSFLIND